MTTLNTKTTMYLIEPCCASKHFMLLRDAIGSCGKATFEGYGDLSLTELLPAILTRYAETRMMIIAPAIPDQAADIIYEWLRKTWARMDGKGRINVLSKLTIVADLSEEVSPTASLWLKSNPFPERLTLVDKAQDDTALLLPDMTIVGPVNMRYGKHFVCEVTTRQEEVNELWDFYSKFTKRTNRTARKTAKAVAAPADKADDEPADSASSALPKDEDASSN